MSRRLETEKTERVEPRYIAVCTTPITVDEERAAKATRACNWSSNQPMLEAQASIELGRHITSKHGNISEDVHQGHLRLAL